jgi:hypothetical protein
MLVTRTEGHWPVACTQPAVRMLARLQTTAQPVGANGHCARRVLDASMGLGATGLIARARRATQVLNSALSYLNRPARVR